MNSEPAVKPIARRVDDHTFVTSERLTPTPPFPDAVKIELTSHCNYKCSYCASRHSPRPKGTIDRDFLYRILHQAKAVGVREVGMFLLGESFLVPDLAEHIGYAKQSVGIEYVFLTTNGSLCSPDRLAPVIEAGLDSLKFSINAGTRERYARMHGVDRFETVMDNIRWLRRYLDDNRLSKPRTCVSSIYDEAYVEELEQLRAEVLRHVDEFYYLPLYNQGGHLSGDRHTKYVGNPGRFENLVPPVPCWTLFNAGKITWNGYLTACSFDHDTRFEIADLNRVSLLDAWHHPKFTALRERHLENRLEDSLCSRCLGFARQ